MTSNRPVTPPAGADMGLDSCIQSRRDKSPRPHQEQSNSQHRDAVPQRPPPRRLHRLCRCHHSPTGPMRCVPSGDRAHPRRHGVAAERRKCATGCPDLLHVSSESLARSAPDTACRYGPISSFQYCFFGVRLSLHILRLSSSSKFFRATEDFPRQTMPTAHRLPRRRPVRRTPT